MAAAQSASRRTSRAIAAAGQHPHLAAALADQGDGPADAGPADSGPAEPLFERAMTRVLTGLLPPVPPPAGRR